MLQPPPKKSGKSRRQSAAQNKRTTSSSSGFSNSNNGGLASVGENSTDDILSGFGNLGFSVAPQQQQNVQPQQNSSNGGEINFDLLSDGNKTTTSAPPQQQPQPSSFDPFADPLDSASTQPADDPFAEPVQGGDDPFGDLSGFGNPAPQQQQGEPSSGSESESDSDSNTSGDEERDNVQDLKRAPPPPPPEGKNVTVNGLAVMREGVSMLKYGGSGYPHFRQFQITHNNSAIQWFSKGKNMTDTTINFSQITDIRKGQTTANFMRHKAPGLVSTSMSVIYTSKGKAKSLDVVAKELSDFMIFFNVVSVLYGKYRAGESLGGIEEVLVKMSAKVAASSGVGELTDTQTGRRASTFVKNTPLDARSATTQSKGNLTEARKQLQTLKARNARKKTKLQSDVVRRSDQYNVLVAKFKLVDQHYEEAKEAYTHGVYNEVNKHVWKANCELDAITNVTGAIINASKPKTFGFL